MPPRYPGAGFSTPGRGRDVAPRQAWRALSGGPDRNPLPKRDDRAAGVRVEADVVHHLAHDRDAAAPRSRGGRIAPAPEVAQLHAQLAVHVPQLHRELAALAVRIGVLDRVGPG